MVVRIHPGQSYASASLARSPTLQSWAKLLLETVLGQGRDAWLERALCSLRAVARRKKRGEQCDAGRTVTGRSGHTAQAISIDAVRRAARREE